MKLSRAELKTLVFADYYLKQVESDNLYLLLHGFNQTGEQYYRQLESVLPKQANVLVPNGMFPLPRRKGDRFSMGFSWYFYDHTRDFYYMDQRVAVDFLLNLLKKLNLDQHRLHIWGYSQGGYLAPFVARECSNTSSLLGIACRFIDELKVADFPSRVAQIHASGDEFVDFDKSKKSFDRLRGLGMQGDYIELSDSNHAIDDSYLEAVTQILETK